jgi:hypothetical protein
MKNYESLVDALDDLRKRGYESDFATDKVCLYCGDLDIRLDPEDFHIDEAYRFEGGSNPDDNVVLYAISSSTGVKGILVDGNGAYTENLSFDMARKLQDHSAITN